MKMNLEQTKQAIEKACAEIGKNPDEIVLVGVTKTVPAEVVNQAIEQGLTDVGESKVQEAEQKFPLLKPCVKHLVGHLQSNKVKKAVELFDFIQSVDSLKLAVRISEECEKIGKEMPILIQVKSDESKEFGVLRAEVHNLLREISILSHIKVMGLMSIGPWYTEDPAAAVESFRAMKDLFDEMKEKGIPNVDMRYLSMGMSDDFEVAIKEGANMVRIGRALFGERE